jgi:hypothetical protein
MNTDKKGFSKRVRRPCGSVNLNQRLIGSQLLELHEQWLTEEASHFNMEHAGK